ncbi:MAG TPA: alcohol dehydrogenase catalytic domain-containing protein [Bryobacteraceae bacterium]|nr:alcohol dehydrogenase catalytic domain-containing protein [Bryobacteraceae bacterium]
MKAILITEPPHFEVASVPDPPCNPGQVLIRTAYCGICGTDLEILRGGMPAGFARYPVVPGHEWTGAVQEVGSGVTNFRKGDRVSVEGYLPCGQCPRCIAGEFNLCPCHEQIGMTHNGGLAEFVVAPAQSCHLVPEHVGLDDALMVEPASTVVRAIGRANPRPRSNAAVIGCGPIGLIAARVLALYQPANLLGIDLATTQQAMAIRAGFHEFVTGTNVRELRERSGSDGWDIVVVCAGGAKPLETAIQMARTGGTIVAIGGSPDSHILQIAANLFVTRDLHIEGILGYTTESWIRTLDWLASGKLRVGDLITHRRTINQFDQALALVESRSEPIGKVAITFV